jgi:hypothetical protein
MPQKVQALNTRQTFAGLRSKWSQALTDCKKFLPPGGPRQLPESFPAMQISIRCRDHQAVDSTGQYGVEEALRPKNYSGLSFRESSLQGEGETSVASLKNPRLDWPNAPRKIKPVQLRFFLHVKKAGMRTGLKHNSCPDHPSHHGFMLWRTSISTWS